MLNLLHKLRSRNTAWIFVLFAIVLLSGCSHISGKDGAPNYSVDETGIPDAVPKVEPLSKSGNMDHYTVHGKRYFIMKNSKHYQEQGIASWYGTKFHAHHTSSGERYNMLAMTAAHKTLPLPSYVQVTNLKNGKKVIVRVNDRGPFESNRLIDLSYVAAKKLGMIGHGTTHVDVKAIDPHEALAQPELLAKKSAPDFPSEKFNSEKTHFAEAAPARDSKPEHIVSYASAKKPSHNVKIDATVYLQVGAFHSKSHADKIKKKLVALLAAPVSVNHPSSKIFRVQVGPFKDIASANRASKRLKSVGLHSERLTESFDITHEL
jgi:rare lipoprotein A